MTCLQRMEVKQLIIRVILLVLVVVGDDKYEE